MSRCLLRVSLPYVPVAGPSSLVGVRFRSNASWTAARKQRIQRLRAEAALQDGDSSSTPPSPSGGPRVHPLRQKKVDERSSSSSSSSCPPPFGLTTPPPPNFPPDPTLSPFRIRQKSTQLEWYDNLDSLPVEDQIEWKRQARIRRKASLLHSDEARSQYYAQIARSQYLSGLGVVEKARVLLEEKLASLGSEEEREEYLLRPEAKRRWERIDEREREEMMVEQRRLMGLIKEREKSGERELEGMEEGSEEKEVRRRELEEEVKVAMRERSYVKYRGLGMEVGKSKVVKGEERESRKETSEEEDASKEEKRD